MTELDKRTELLGGGTAVVRQKRLGTHVRVKIGYRLFPTYELLSWGSSMSCLPQEDCRHMEAMLGCPRIMGSADAWISSVMLFHTGF